MPQQLIPGTKLAYEQNDGMFAMFQPLIKATDGLALNQICAITGLEASTIQNWVKRGFVARPVNKRYHARQLARILLISSLRECMKIESIGELMTYINGNADDEADDIISEERLYDCFCEVAVKSDRLGSDADISALIKEVLKDYKAPNNDAYKKLSEALEIMVYAHIASQYKKKAEQRLSELKG